jgi:cell division protein FtsI/penicillin-binding protein 2
MLIEIASGNVLAMASWRAGADPRAASFSPTQCVYEPGSVVKPLVFALALERGVLSPTTRSTAPRTGRAAAIRSPAARTRSTTST